MTTMPAGLSKNGDKVTCHCCGDGLARVERLGGLRGYTRVRAHHENVVRLVRLRRGWHEASPGRFAPVDPVKRGYRAARSLLAADLPGKDDRLVRAVLEGCKQYDGPILQARDLPVVIACLRCGAESDVALDRLSLNAAHSRIEG